MPRPSKMWANCRRRESARCLPSKWGLIAPCAVPPSKSRSRQGSARIPGTFMPSFFAPVALSESLIFTGTNNKPFLNIKTVNAGIQLHRFEILFGHRPSECAGFPNADRSVSKRDTGSHTEIDNSGFLSRNALETKRIIDFDIGINSAKVGLVAATTGN